MPSPYEILVNSVKGDGTSGFSVDVSFYDNSTGILAGDVAIPVAATSGAAVLTWDQKKAVITAAIIAFFGTFSFIETAADVIYPEDVQVQADWNETNMVAAGYINNKPNVPTYKSYQTVVSQTGSAAPTDGTTPVNAGYAGITFAWARSSAGVYTLTASANAFVTGKTSLINSQVPNLNAVIKGVVTSPTVFTVTSAVQSVAILGLLGLTTTPTDGILSGTLIDVRTYP